MLRSICKGSTKTGISEVAVNNKACPRHYGDWRVRWDLFSC